MVSFRESEQTAAIRDAESSRGKAPQDRFAIFADLVRTADAIRESLPLDERRRRAEIARLLDPLPDPWWKNFSAEALAEHQCQTSSN